MDCRTRGGRYSGLVVLMLVVALVVSACSTLANGRRWGEDAIYPLRPGRISRAAYRALLDWQTLIPAGGAVLFAVNDFDDRVSHWATKHNPIFGSEHAARNVSDYLRGMLQAEVLLTALATPSGDDPKQWLYSKAKGLGVELAAQGITEGVTALFKETISRTRPDLSDNDSFPSGHASGAFCSATLANRNLDSIHISAQARGPLQAANIFLAAGVAWARVEGRQHYPSDVLAGAALGHFFSAFIHDAFLGLPPSPRVGFFLCPRRGGAMASVSFAF